MKQLIQFNRNAKWSFQDKKNVIGDYFFNEGTQEYFVLVDVLEDKKNPTTIYVANANGKVKKTDWNKAAHGKVPMGTTGLSEQTFLDDKQAQPYRKYIDELRTFLNGQTNNMAQDPKPVELPKPAPLVEEGESGAEKLVGSLFDIIKQKHKYVALINGRLVAHNKKKHIWEELDAESKKGPVAFKWVIGG